jgi:hypothetical protein
VKDIISASIGVDLSQLNPDECVCTTIPAFVGTISDIQGARPMAVILSQANFAHVKAAAGGVHFKHVFLILPQASATVGIFQSPANRFVSELPAPVRGISGFVPALLRF